MSKQVFYKRENGERFWRLVPNKYIRELEDTMSASGSIEANETLVSLTVDTICKFINKKDPKQYLELISLEIE